MLMASYSVVCRPRSLVCCVVSTAPTSDKIKLSSDKADKKFAYRHSGYPGGIRATRWSDLLANDPVKLVFDSIKGMVPHTRLGRAQMGKLFVYSGPTHPHAAQQPVPFDTSAIRRG